MHAQDVKLIDLFHGSVRFLMPMFQRPYVWGEEKEWAPLWQDIRHQAEMVLAAGHYGDAPSHFLGAIVTEPRATFGLTEHVVIDGQQRLTTLQLLIDAAERIVDELGNPSDAADLQVMILNEDSHGKTPDDETRYKVWPTNRDREAFAAAMDDVRPVPSQYAESRLVRAHHYFSESIKEWGLADGHANAAARLGALARTLRTQLVLVGISLSQGDNAQAIFETLNYLGAPLLAADLIKNHLFQRAEKEHRNLEQLHKKYWAGFDGDGSGDEYWRQKVRQGRLTRPRIDLFLTHWLVMKLGREVPSDRIFAEFRDRVSKDVVNVENLMKELHTDAMAYRQFMDAPRGSVEETFRYRVLEVLDANAVMPAVLWVIAHDVPADERKLALESLESWLVRRSILRLGSKDLTHFSIELVKRLEEAGPARAGTDLRNFLIEQETPARHWPDDASIVEHLQTAPFYKQAKRSVNRMLLEAAEEMLRRDKKAEEVLCPRDLSVEHVMPQKWATHWPLHSGDPSAGERRDLMVQTLGNLTLVTPGHNSALSNSAWLADGQKGKRDYLLNNAVLKLNAELYGHSEWTEDSIAARGTALAQLVARAWPRPEGGVTTKTLLASPVRQKRTMRTGRAVYEIHGPDFSESDLTRRAALRQMIQRVHAAGVSMELIGATMSTARFRQVPGILEGQELFHQLVARFGVNPDYESRWLLDQPIHEAGSTWVLQEGMGQNRAHTALDKLSALVEGFGWSTTARATGGARQPGDGDVGRWWCIHNDQIPGEELQAGGFVSIGWDLLGDLRVLGADREGIKESFRAHYPGAKEGAYTNWASMVAKFSHELEPGDWVISPVKASRTVDIGVITGPYWYEETAVSHRHRLPVQWMVTGLDRDEFSLDARYEIGGALTLFRVRRTVAEFADQVELPASDRPADLQ